MVKFYYKRGLRGIQQKCIISVIAVSCFFVAKAQQVAPYVDAEQPMEARVQDLIGRLTLEEKVSQMMHASPAIERLKIPAYNWWNEALHGVGRGGVATVFPQAIGMGATFDKDLLYRVS